MVYLTICLLLLCKFGFSLFDFKNRRVLFIWKDNHLKFFLTAYLWFHPLDLTVPFFSQFFNFLRPAWIMGVFVRLPYNFVPIAFTCRYISTWLLFLFETANLWLLGKTPACSLFNYGLIHFQIDILLAFEGSLWFLSRFSGELTFRFASLFLEYCQYNCGIIFYEFFLESFIPIQLSATLDQN